MKWYISLFVILILSGCSAEWHLSRAVRKNPELLKSQTINVTDTIVLPGVELMDTVILKQVDTITLVKDRFRVKIMRSFDTLIIDGGCDSDTIVRTVQVVVPQLVRSESRMQKVQRFTFWSFVSLLLVAIAVVIVRRSIKI
jgi:PBP1b-binding outer membrane lipoprotein LpoB